MIIFKIVDGSVVMYTEHGAYLGPFGSVDTNEGVLKMIYRAIEMGENKKAEEIRKALGVFK